MRSCGTGSIRSGPYLLFVGRIARQKGIIHLVRAIQYMDPGFQIVLCAGAPDTPEIAAEMKAAISAAQAKRSGIIWIEAMVDQGDRAPALRARRRCFVVRRSMSRLGSSISKRWPAKQRWWRARSEESRRSWSTERRDSSSRLTRWTESPFEPTKPEKFERDLATRINQLMADPDLQEEVWAGGTQAGAGEVQLGRDRAGNASGYTSR